MVNRRHFIKQFGAFSLAFSGFGRALANSSTVHQLIDQNYNKGYGPLIKDPNGILDLWSENVWLAARGGGIGSYWGNLRSIGEKIGRVGKTSGIIPFIKVMDSLTMAISQGSSKVKEVDLYSQTGL